jgi:hypothetical protein
VSCPASMPMHSRGHIGRGPPLTPRATPGSWCRMVVTQKVLKGAIHSPTLAVAVLDTVRLHLSPTRATTRTRLARP